MKFSLIWRNETDGHIVRITQRQSRISLHAALFKCASRLYLLPNRRRAACLHEISIFLFISDHFLSGFSELMPVTSCDRCRFPSLSQTSSACCRVTVPRCSRNPFDFKVVLTPVHNKVNRVPALLIAHTLVTVTILWSQFFCSIKWKNDEF